MGVLFRDESKVAVVRAWDPGGARGGGGKNKTGKQK
jgi:hypothetical protein